MFVVVLLFLMLLLLLMMMLMIMMRVCFVFIYPNCCFVGNHTMTVWMIMWIMSCLHHRMAGVCLHLFVFLLSSKFYDVDGILGNEFYEENEEGTSLTRVPQRYLKHQVSACYVCCYVCFHIFTGVCLSLVFYVNM